jgi:hypothetical protein
VVTEIVDLRDSDTKAKFASPTLRLQERLISGLAKLGFQVVERGRLEAVLAENAVSQSGITADSQAVHVGRLANADVVLMGALLTYDRPLYPKARLSLTFRAVAVSRGATERTIEVEIDKSNWLYPVDLLDDVVDLALEAVLKAVEAGG